MADVNYDGLTDEELMQLPDPEEMEDPTLFTEENIEPTFEEELDTATEEPDAETEPTQIEPKQLEAEEVAAEGEAADDADEIEEEVEATTEEPVIDPMAETEEEQKAPEKVVAKDDKTDAVDEEPDYKALYEEVMAPFKANGKEFKPQSSQEAVRLMQQGANYVKKMTALRPNLKLMRMLQNQDLLDEEKLTFLIDVHRRDPAAIQKLLKDGDVDPMSIDTDEEPKYSPGDHKVSDDEMAFHSTLEEVLSSSTGSKTVKLINDTWDARGKEEVYRDPDILKLMDQHRQSGIYDKIATEIDRQMTLGDISTNIPFIEAYKTVGDKLFQAGRLIPQNQEQGNRPNAYGSSEQTRTPVATSKPKRTVASNGDRVKAASPTRSTPKAPAKEFDPFAMSDDELMKATSPRF